MKTFIARWPNGDVSFVVANSREEACLLLDDICDPFDVNLTPVDESRLLAVHVKLMDDGEIRFDEVSEGLFNSVQKAWPLIDAERDR